MPLALEVHGRPKRVAGITTVYFHNSHADVILSRLLQGYNLDYRDPKPNVELASLYVDQFPTNDISRALSDRHGVKIYSTIADALTLGGNSLAVDGVLIIGEHGEYPVNPKGQEMYPRKRFFDEIVNVFRRSNKVVPVYMDKHLSHSWDEAKQMYDTARTMRIPLMAGSSVPLTWRRPHADVERDAKLNEVVGVSFHTLYGYGFHALEMVQCLAERRFGAETGIRRVQCIEGAEVWQRSAELLYDRQLLELALSRQEHPPKGDLPLAAPHPVLFHIEYMDGFRANVFVLNPAVGQWSAAWSTEDGSKAQSTLFWTQEARPLGHFSFLLRGIERMIHTGRPSWPVERTLMTTGLMDRLLESKLLNGATIETPELRFGYQSNWTWKDPGMVAPSRPLDQQ